ncbi:T9SS type A sorting domain-containing protein [Portibacter marinus]|uniref:T9SS type A sorting domain-containing protein n=1 Tax=Portibacter marinus TaxID=2898660 RepID=UPI001F485E34|nr:T9SS type A sorting domain-containing protein [Portibacter marinus]
MKFLSPKIIFITLVLMSVGQYGKTCEIVSFIAPERLCLDRAGSFQGNGLKEPGCGLMTTENIEVVAGPGDFQISFTNDERNRANIIFDQVGTYTIRYTFKDETDCNSDPCIIEKTTEVYYPEAFFVEDTINICRGETIETAISFVNAENASVEGQGSLNVPNSGNNMGVYRTSAPVNQSLVLKITRAQDGTCTNEVLLDSLVVNVLDIPKLTAIDTICDDKNEMYRGVYKITGGDGIYTLLTPEIGIIDGDILTTKFLPSLQSFNYRIDSGPTCGEFQGSATAECKCTAAAGLMQSEEVEACQDEIVEVLHNKSSVDKRPTDSILYVLHNSDQNEIGAFYDVSYDPIFTLPSEELVDSQLYISAVVGPFTIENFAINEVECKAVSAGTPVRWFSKDEFKISGLLDVCAGEKNRMYKVTLDAKLKDRDNLFWETNDGSGFVIESQSKERAYVTFPTASSSGKLYYQIDRKISNTKFCSSRDSVAITIDGTESAPEAADIILWPGDIFASTSDGPCYQWGFVDRFANFSVELVGQNSKFFFSPEAIGQGKLTDRAYFCATYDTPNCEFSFNNCNSITFYNQNTLNGLVEGTQDDFVLGLSPNPNDGRMRLDILGNYKGIYKLELFSELGERVSSKVIDKTYVRSITDLDFSDVPKGIYFLRVQNELGHTQIIKTAITR